MMLFITKVINYITASIYRKTFFICIGLAGAAILINIAANSQLVSLFGALCVTIGTGASLAESMIKRVEFKKEIAAMQMEHFQKVIDSGADEHGIVEGTFSPTEATYLRKEKTRFVLMILMKTLFMIILFGLIFKV